MGNDLDYQVQKYSMEKLGDKVTASVFVALISEPKDILEKKNNRLIAALTKSGLDTRIGLYFYRFKNLEKYKAFSKIGEVSRKEGIKERLKRGWHGTAKYGDSYFDKVLHADVKLVSKNNPMYFVFYEQVPEYGFPKIDELHAFNNHRKVLGFDTRNIEKTNKNISLGSKIIWRASSFDEVLNLKFPDGSSYEI